MLFTGENTASSKLTHSPYLSFSTSPERRSTISSHTLSDVPSDFINKIRIKYGSRWTACQGLMAEYSKSSTIHGIRYIFEIHRPFYEKFFWFILMIISFYFAISLMSDTYLKWLESPVILVFDESLVPVNTIPFPTITICPEIKRETNTFDFTKVSQKIWAEIDERRNFENLTVEELQDFVATLQLCDNEVIDRFSPYMPKDLHVDVVQSVVDLAINSNTTMPFCKWNGRFYYCRHLVKHVLTDEGICYQFNGLQTENIYRDPNYLKYSDDTKEDFNKMFDTYLPKYKEVTGSWSLDEGYVGQGFNAYPQRSVLSSARNGLFVALMGFEHNFDYACRSFKNGYKVFLNSPESVPLTTGNYILVPHDHEVLVSVYRQYIKSTDNLHDIGPEKRQCYFNDERYLHFFRTYSQSNCQTECLVNFTIARCGCAKFWMPKPSHVPICSLGDVNCYTSAADEMTLLISNLTSQNAKDPRVQIMCDCMPACTSLDYNFEISRSYYDYEKTLSAWRDSYDHDDGRGARLSIYYKENQFTAIKRTVMYTVTTLVANCGGIFGLFMGISILSVIEVVFFFSVRLSNNLYKRRMVKNKLIQLDLESMEDLHYTIQQ